MTLVSTLPAAAAVRLAPDRVGCVRVPDDVAALLSARFPRPDAVAAAVTGLDVAAPWDGREGLRFSVEVSGGVLGLRAYDPVRRERSGNPPLPRSLPSALARWDHLSPSAPTLVGGQASDLSARWFLEEALRARGVDVARLDEPFPRASPRAPIVAWSAKSRAYMVRTLAELDWSPVFDSGLPPAVVTLTYPRAWLDVAPTGAAVKRHLRALQRRWERRWGAPPAGAWKLEFQGRAPGRRSDDPRDDGRAPHFHLFVTPPVPPTVRGRGHLVVAQEFAAWLSAAWADVVAHPDRCAAPAPPPGRVSCCEWHRHLVAGTAVDYADGVRMRDPLRLAVYFIGHSLKHRDGKEYQHRVPRAWREPGSGPGRWWGYWRLDRVRIVRDVEVAQFIAWRRLLRRSSRAKNRTRQISVPRPRVIVLDGADVVLAGRRVRRTQRIVTCRGGRLVGGWRAVNDAPALVGQASAWVAQEARRLLERGNVDCARGLPSSPGDGTLVVGAGWSGSARAVAPERPRSGSGPPGVPSEPSWPSSGTLFAVE